MRIKTMTLGELHKAADVLRREVEACKVLGKVQERGDAESHLKAVEAEIEGRNQG